MGYEWMGRRQKISGRSRKLKDLCQFCLILLAFLVRSITIPASADGCFVGAYFVCGNHDSFSITQSRSISELCIRKGSSESSAWPQNPPPYLALITEPDACDNETRMQETVSAVKSAVSTGKISLVSVRTVRPDTVTLDDFESRVVDLTSRLMALSTTMNNDDDSNNGYRVVVTSDWVEAAVRASAHGIHVKERDRYRIPDIRLQFGGQALIGTSAHSVPSALEALQYKPDYLFAGTCYPTESHPEKTTLEGPGLPGDVRRAIDKRLAGNPPDGGISPIVFAIGGIDETNCNEPVNHGADGVAVIRSVIQAADPASAVNDILHSMRQD